MTRESARYNIRIGPKLAIKSSEQCLKSFEINPRETRKIDKVTDSCLAAFEHITHCSCVNLNMSYTAIVLLC